MFSLAHIFGQNAAAQVIVMSIRYFFGSVTDLLFSCFSHRCFRESQESCLSISWPRSFTCSSVAQTLAGAAYLPTIVFAFWGRPLRSSLSPPRFRFSLDCCLLSILPFGFRPCFLQGLQYPPFTFYTCLPRFLSGSLPFRSAPDWNYLPAPTLIGFFIRSTPILHSPPPSWVDLFISHHLGNCGPPAS